MARELFDNVEKIVEISRRFHTRLHEEVIILNFSIIFFIRISYFYSRNTFTLNTFARKQIYIIKKNIH